MIRLADLSLRRPRDPEAGFSLPELIVAIFVGTTVLGGLFTLVSFTVRSNAQTTSRVAVDQQARPAMQRVIDELHSTCVYPGLAPIQAGSTGSTLSMLHATGTAASPTPVLRRISYTGTTTTPGALIDTTYNTNGGTAPNWTFSSTVAQRFYLLNRVAQLNSSTPIFRYYRYLNGAISSTPLTTPLTVDSAKLVVQVTVNFKAALEGADIIDKGNSAAYSGSALLRFSPSNEDTSKAGLPCT